MGQSFYFYDLETSGFNPRTNRIMQFAGQRTDMELRPLGKPDNILVKLSSDILPEPDAVLVHGITPQKAADEGLSEAEFLKTFSSKIAKPETIMTGFNNIRFDDEFMRFCLWRNFYDAYEWQWKDDSSKWDLLDVVRMTRALRPEGINWPFDPEGKPSNRLEYLSSVNKLNHSAVHDAESDVQAVIGIARLLKAKQPKLFDYLLKLRDKNKVAVLLGGGEPFVYTSGRYPSDFHKTTIAVAAAIHPDGRGAFVYDLRIDPEPYLKMSAEELAELWQASFFRPKEDEDRPNFPIKLLAYNRCPAVAPLGTLDKASTRRLKINMSEVEKHLKSLKKDEKFEHKIVKVDELLRPKEQPKLVLDEQQVDGQLYDGFVSSIDKSKMSVVRAAGEKELSRLTIDFGDERLKLLLPLYKARNFSASLSADEQKWWKEFRQLKLLSGGNASLATRYFKRIEELVKTAGPGSRKRHLLEELKLYGQAVVPVKNKLQV